MRGQWIRRRIVGTLVLATLALATSATAADASSIVFTKSDGNVYLANPDGSGLYQVTLDGSSANPYLYPTQASDGTIMAQRGKGSSAQLYRMNQNGTLQVPPFGTAAPGSGPIDPVITPDASKVAYFFVSMGNGCYPWYTCPSAQAQAQISKANQLTDPSVYNPSNTLYDDEHTSWLSNNRVMLFNGSADVEAFDVGGGYSSHYAWFRFADLFKDPNGNDTSACYAGVGAWEGAASPNDSQLAVVTQAGGYSPPYGSSCDPNYWDTIANNSSIVLLNNQGNVATDTPPQAPSLQGCLIQPPDGSDGYSGGKPWGTAPSTGEVPVIDSVSWSPDGSALAFDYKGDTYIEKIGGPDCSTGWSLTKLSGAAHPYWGPTNINPAPRPSPAPLGGGSTGNGGGTNGGANGTGGGTNGGTTPISGPTSASCRVPKLVGSTLAAAKRAIAQAHCKLGKVTRRHSSPKKKGHVLAQSPRVGTHKPAGAKVNLVIGR